MSNFFSTFPTACPFYFLSDFYILSSHFPKTVRPGVSDRVVWLAILIFLLFTKHENNRDEISHLVNKTKLAGLIWTLKMCLLHWSYDSRVLFIPAGQISCGQFSGGLVSWGVISEGPFPGEGGGSFSRGHFSGHRMRDWYSNHVSWAICSVWRINWRWSP